MYRFLTSFFKPPMSLSDARKQEIDNAIETEKVFVASKTYCPYCAKAKQILKDHKVTNYKLYELDVEKDGNEIQTYLHEKTGQRTVPNIFINGKHIGGSSDLAALASSGELDKLLN